MRFGKRPRPTGARTPGPVPPDRVRPGAAFPGQAAAGPASPGSDRPAGPGAGPWAGPGAGPWAGAAGGPESDAIPIGVVVGAARPRRGAATAGRFQGLFTRRRIILLLVVGAVLAWIGYGDRLSIDAQGVVVGNTTTLATLRRGRLVAAERSCNSPVQAGMPLFGFEHDVDRPTGFAALNVLEERLARARIEIDRAGVALRTAQERQRLAEREAAAARARLSALDALLAAGAITRFDWQDARTRLDSLDAAVALRRAEVTEQQAAVALARRLTMIEARHVETERAAVADREAEDRFSQVYAPAAGILTACTVKPGEVVEAGTPIAELFQPRDAYVLAFFEPAHATRLTIGSEAQVRIVGLAAPVPAVIGPREIEVRELPDTLRRFFWEAPQWAQFQPVQVRLVPADPAALANLRQGARARVRVTVSDPVAWLEDVVDGIWHEPTPPPRPDTFR